MNLNWIRFGSTAAEAGLLVELPEHVQTIIDTIGAERRRHEHDAGPVRRMAARITRGAAKPSAQVLLVVVASGWIGLNVAGPVVGLRPFDPPPFDALANLATGFALIATLLILTTQRHESELAVRQADLTLQLAILSEQRSAKLIQLMDELRRDLPSVEHKHDPETAALAEVADTAVVLEALRNIEIAEPSDAPEKPIEPPE